MLLTPVESLCRDSTAYMSPLLPRRTLRMHANYQYRSHVDAGTLSTALDTLYKYGWEVGWKLDGGLTT